MPHCLPQPRLLRLVAAVALLGAGCVGPGSHLDRQLLATSTGGREQAVEGEYVLGCPDVLDVTISGRPELTRSVTVEADGRLNDGPLGRPRVEGLTRPQIAALLADRLDIAAERIEVRISAYRSRHVYLAGHGIGLQRAVSYQGPETVMQLLQRTGGVTAGAAPEDVYLVRSRLTEGKQPEVFRIDLAAIVRRNDQRTNLRVEPFDQIYVGETRQSSWEKCVPPCLKPLYDSFCGLNHPTMRPLDGPPALPPRRAMLVAALAPGSSARYSSAP